VVIGAKDKRLNISHFLKNLNKSLIKRNQEGNGKFLKLYHSLLRQELQISVDRIIIK
jgi:hypothetical protein